MPEVLTKYPDIVMKLLRKLGAKCGLQETSSPTILKDCPRSNFCEVPNGELCVLGLDKADKLTQFSVTSDTFEIVQDGGYMNGILWIVLILLVVLAVSSLGWYIYERRKRDDKV